mmetsp:Transcript_9577/g.17255  ORF Transcript_9577/g.17255 Transcript_9577/m.17255 type:complete len:107 (+) Transcript_9577:662-982(+)
MYRKMVPCVTLEFPVQQSQRNGCLGMVWLQFVLIEVEFPGLSPCRFSVVFFVRKRPQSTIYQYKYKYPNIIIFSFLYRMSSINNSLSVIFTQFNKYTEKYNSICTT